jgi:AcrR family transcriptional regulator
MAVKKPEAQRVNEILGAALRCFARAGYDKTKMDDIVRESGLTKGGIYWYFESKREIFLALFDRHIREDAARWEAMVRGSPDVAALLRGSARHFFRDHLGEEWLTPLFQEMTAEAFRDEDLKARLNTLINGSIEVLASTFQNAGVRSKGAAVNVRHLVTAFVAMAYGLGVLFHLSGKTLPFEQVWDEIIRALSGGVRFSAKGLRAKSRSVPAKTKKRGTVR